ncbi:Hypothetical protein SRAE_2000152300 [Strongyloides ratti]|uniref:BED-type domain-containing protein n=1 Tax=Strongyloides ratti TaxID=34506 RepID=A0A090LAS2_STRRB|nr:Hypothetical protein SRAE_2000152300 [Strongyloides ratti]CEF66857.1 Hypothetical protein SRAE_2000152300 [Strongyloides ratti]
MESQFNEISSTDGNSMKFEEVLEKDFEVNVNTNLFNIKNGVLKKESTDDYRNINDHLKIKDQECINDKSTRLRSHSTSINYGKAPGRKKTHPVWIFFKDLKDENPDEIGVICLHCNWKGIDKSPNNLQIHLKKFHINDGVYTKYCDTLATIPIHPYARRKGVSSNSSSSNSRISNSSMPRRLNDCSRINTYQFDPPNIPTFNPLLNSVIMAPGINILPQNILPHMTNNHHNNPFVNIFDTNIPLPSKKPFLSNDLGVSTYNVGTENFFSNLFNIARDMNISITYSYNNQDEFIFSRKDINDKPNNFTKSVILKDYPYEIKVYEKNENHVIECETFQKTDWLQMHWALRGKIQSILFNNNN